jgi:ABC-type lipoprotein export system ATPase subunit
VRPTAAADFLVVLQKRLKTLRKKLRDITDIEEQKEQGKELTPEVLQKLEKKEQVLGAADEVDRLVSQLNGARPRRAAIARA